ncbi:fimbrial protein [Pseudomonas sp. HLT2-19-2]
MWSQSKCPRFNRRCLRVLWLFSLSSLAWLWDVGPVHSATIVSISGTIQANPSCVLNNNQNIVISFGNAVRTEEINGINYMQPVLFSIACKNLKTNTVRLQIKGVADDHNSSTLQTSIPGLGLAFYSARRFVGVNTWFDVDHRDVRLEVAPFKLVTGAISDGYFDARATLLVDFP